MLHIPIKYNSKTDTNAVAKHRIYEVVKDLSVKYMGDNVVVVDTPGPAVVERTRQFNTPGFQYLAAEHNTKLRNRLGKDLFVGKEWWDLSNSTLTQHSTAVLSFDGTMSPITFLTDGFLEKTYDLCTRVQADKPFILNLCFSKRPGRGWKKKLISTKRAHLRYKKQPILSVIQNIRFHLFAELRKQEWKPVPLLLGNSQDKNIFHYGNPGHGMGSAMVNMIIPVLPKTKTITWEHYHPAQVARLVEEGTHPRIAKSMVWEQWDAQERDYL